MIGSLTANHLPPRPIIAPYIFIHKFTVQILCFNLIFSPPHKSHKNTQQQE